MSLITALNPGLTGILSQQKQVEITGNNIANVNTPGYSRQSATLTPMAAIQIQGLFMGQGVKVADVGRAYDQFVTGQLVDQNDVLGRENAKSGPLSQLERIFGIGEDSLAGDIEGFFGAWHDLSQNPAGSVEREQVIYKGENLLDAFDKTKSDLVVARQNINDTLNAEVGGINLKLQELADLNADIKQKETLGHVASLDQDRRDLLVKELSNILGIKTYDTGSSQIGAQLPGGIPLVEGDTAVDFQSYYDGDQLKFQIKSGDITLPADKSNFGGQFKGLLDVRDELIPELEGRVNALEYNIVTQVNAQHEAGYGLDGRTGRSFFTKQPSYQSQEAFADPDDLAFNTGTMTIQLDGATSGAIDIEQGDNSLNGIRDAINNADAGVLAAVVPDSDGNYHLDLTPETEGAVVTIGSGSLTEDDEFDWDFDEAPFEEQPDGIYHSSGTLTCSDPDMLSFNKGEIQLVIGEVGSEETFTVDIEAGSNSLNGIRDAINASDAGVLARVEQEAAGDYFLAVRPPEKSLAVAADLPEGEGAINDSFPDPGEPLIDDTLTLTFTVDGVDSTVTVDAAASSLNGIRDAVNDQVGGDGIHASLTSDGDNYQLDFAAYEPMTITPALSDNEAYEFSGLVAMAGSGELAVGIESTGAIAAAGIPGGAPGDNENALAIHALVNAPLAEDNKSFVDAYGRMASRVGSETRRNSMARDGAEDSMNQLENLRESIVGVSIEEEMINLTMFQKGFEASSRYVQTIDEMLGTIIGLKR